MRKVRISSSIALAAEVIDGWVAVPARPEDEEEDDDDEEENDDADDDDDDDDDDEVTIAVVVVSDDAAGDAAADAAPAPDFESPGDDGCATIGFSSSRRRCNRSLLAEAPRDVT